MTLVGALESFTSMLKGFSVELRIRNIGPIRSANIAVEPLTIFVGPNNSGKSVASTLLYTVLTTPIAIPPGLRLFKMRRGIRLGNTEFDRDQLRAIEEEAAILCTAADPATVGRTRISPLLTGFLSSALMASYREYGTQLLLQLERSFNSKVDDLVRTSGGRRMPSSFSLQHDAPEWHFDVKLSRPRPRFTMSYNADISALIRSAFQTSPGFLRSVRSRPPSEGFAPALAGLALRATRTELPSATYYLPAARSGILQSHRALAAAVVRGAASAGFHDVRIPKMSGVVSDFISELLTIDDEFDEATFGDAASALERVVLAGAIALEARPDAYPDISYEREDSRYPLHRTSSMVSEMAPIVLYLRYLLDPGELLIIEEPEAHLHPESQVRLAEVLVTLAERGAMLLLTTHSDFLLQQFNNSIRAAVVQQRLSGAKTEMPTLSADRVGAYLFAYDDTKGTNVRRIRVSSEDGIPDDDFSRVAETLYRASARLNRKLSNVQ